MHELALYRKYRPASFKEVMGQNHIVSVLEGSIKTKKVSHAYLFIGSRGTGKTSVARIFAKEIGVSVNDLYEIDAASNRGIADIKDLREGARVLPFDSKYKIYIIDEVHMLSGDAWGALLKILEEPPSHVIFILATTEVHKIPETIISRCQVFTFKKASNTALKNIILSVAEKEGYEIDGSSAELLAILGDGSFRDGLGILQKVLNFARNKKIKREEIEEITGAPRVDMVNQYLMAILEKDLEKGLSAIKEASTSNLDMELYLKIIIEKFRLSLMLRYAPNLEDKIKGDISEEDLKFIKDILKKDKDGMFRSSSLTILLGAYSDIRKSFISELPLELALIKIIEEKN